MKVIRRNYASLKEGSVVTIGNFEGLHLGHQALLDKLVSKSLELGLPSVVITFQPSPKQYFSSSSPVVRLMALKEKLNRFRERGVDYVLLLNFNESIAQLSPEAFIVEYLLDKLSCKQLFVGDDFHFGHNRVGDAKQLQALGEKFGYEVFAMPPISLNGERISSTLIRDKLQHGKVSDIERLLGRPYQFEARVCHGSKKGRLLGFPTANMIPPKICLPMKGVYHVRIQGLEKIYYGVANLGIKPTVGGNQLLCETHLFECDKNLYGKRLTIEFLNRIREEILFDSLDELRSQISEDVKIAKSIAEYY